MMKQFLHVVLFRRGEYLGELDGRQVEIVGLCVSRDADLPDLAPIVLINGEFRVRAATRVVKVGE